MASPHHKFIFMLVLYIFLSLALQQFELADASRFSSFSPPPPVEIIHREISFNSFNKYEIKDTPTVTPGHSPGMGHDTPPGAS